MDTYDDIYSHNVVGGIEIVYETSTGEDIVDGIPNIKCKSYDEEAVVLEFKDNEYITTISGKGKDFIKYL